MGIPYSRQINAAFDEVTPLVAAGYQVLRTTKNVSLLLAGIQVLTTLLLLFICLGLFALLITLNPHLESERDILVTPVLQWACDAAIKLGQAVVWTIWLLIVGGMAGAGAGGMWLSGERERRGRWQVVRTESGQDVVVDLERVDGEGREMEGKNVGQEAAEEKEELVEKAVEQAKEEKEEEEGGDGDEKKEGGGKDEKKGWFG